MVGVIYKICINIFLAIYTSFFIENVLKSSDMSIH